MQKSLTIENVGNLEDSFTLVPNNFQESHYLARTDRNLGWITKYEQEILLNSTVGIAGCGGMGGLLAATLLRLGIGHIKVADLEVFDASNLNRQVAAGHKTLGRSKAIETARHLRTISEDSSVYVYPKGINSSSVSEFVDRCDVICDELEFWAIGARILLHKNLPANCTLLNANSIGMGTRLFRFTTQSQWKIEEILGFKLERARQIEKRFLDGSIRNAEKDLVMKSVLRGLVPRIPEYMRDLEKYSNEQQLRDRLANEGRAAIIATNPPMATGFLANHVLLEILRKKSSLKRAVVYPPSMPGYLYWDAATMKAEVVLGIWW